MRQPVRRLHASRSPERWIVVASGPSASDVDFSWIRQRTEWNVLAVNCSWRLVPWAHAMYAGDLAWWCRYGAGAELFPGERWTRNAIAARRFRLNLVSGSDAPGLCTLPGRVHNGGNSGYQAINLAFHFGAKRIVMLGFDMHRQNGAHWHGDHRGMLNAPDRHIVRWRELFVPLANDLLAAGVQLVNATEGTALECVPRMDLESALR